jgi:hypothetical protein
MSRVITLSTSRREERPQVDPNTVVSGFVIIPKIKVVDQQRIKRSLMASGFRRQKDIVQGDGSLRILGSFCEASRVAMESRFIEHGIEFYLEEEGPRAA